MAQHIDNDALARMGTDAINQRLDVILAEAEPTMDELYEAKALLDERDRRRLASH